MNDTTPINRVCDGCGDSQPYDPATWTTLHGDGCLWNFCPGCRSKKSAGADRVTGTEMHGFPELTNAENEEIRKARSLGFSVFYPSFPNAEAQANSTLKGARAFLESKTSDGDS